MAERSPAAAFASDVASAVASLVAVAFIVDVWTGGGVLSRFKRNLSLPTQQTNAAGSPNVEGVIAEATRIAREAAS